MSVVIEHPATARAEAASIAHTASLSRTGHALQAAFKDKVARHG